MVSRISRDLKVKRLYVYRFGLGFVGSDERNSIRDANAAGFS